MYLSTTVVGLRSIPGCPSSSQAHQSNMRTVSTGHLILPISLSQSVMAAMWGRAGYHVYVLLTLFFISSSEFVKFSEEHLCSLTRRPILLREGRLFLLHLVLACTPQLSNPPSRRPPTSYLTAAPWPRVWRTVPCHILAPLSGPPGIWLLDCSIVDRGMVVPQRMWSPHSALDRRRQSNFFKYGLTVVPDESIYSDLLPNSFQEALGLDSRLPSLLQVCRDQYR
ncbi:hypothetical protein EDB92DRAFT_1272785 [Lactarius akahatsu]|uniref:Uncharacterized protein n=1 Tax=Lactarius akahatsu TaxID=416441 RepID=A0AAD4LA92_9AGAM|nr:hypothetical protein EDB92DRAFT_1272785 [Lactarius akahatsu]